MVPPRTQAIQCDSKYLWLTKSVLQEGMPEVYDESVTEATLKRLSSYLHKSILQAKLFQIESNHRSKAEPFAQGLLQDIMRIFWSINPLDEHPYMSKASLAYRPTIAAYWTRDFEMFQIEDRPTYVLRCKFPLGKFAEPKIEQLRPAKYLPVGDLGLFKRHVHLDSFPGYKIGNPLPYIHTQIIIDRKSYKSEQTIARGIISSFAQLAAHAQNKDGKLGQSLKHPLCCQTIITNGQQFTFMCYQLNTLKTNNIEKGLVNMAWASDTMDLFSSYNGEIDINEKCLKYIAQFFVNKPIPFKVIKKKSVKASEEVVQ
ncbi:uncharacterized protein TRIADDRAFT_60151 [Trichoplax adhaerens]|uniref:39S ribosomal protein L37, mitochondrial n=1 Tax=Trichoplax adhaerens TaxID=10228 RepID=B3S7G0_TRIAD|nr:hypothetical protein TRIADDRAFT_60151 [Trichoplax adhaerens]EDV21282.1 hypothetical protein TRIADDRAFT_60151 [Trichoplax adhaerens]|eukprot:XP_002116249.1 hypothetical protein TRIADDRAFT_60151 [Trichoplax adhaerens]